MCDIPPDQSYYDTKISAHKQFYHFLCSEVVWWFNNDFKLCFSCEKESGQEAPPFRFYVEVNIAFRNNLFQGLHRINLERLILVWGNKMVPLSSSYGRTYCMMLKQNLTVCSILNLFIGEVWIRSCSHMIRKGATLNSHVTLALIKGGWGLISILQNWSETIFS